MTIEEIKQICRIYDNFRREQDVATIAYNSEDTFWTHILTAYNFSQLSLPDNLDEAAEEYGRKEYSHAIHFWDEGLSKNKPEVMKEDFVNAFKAGAEWMAGQGVSWEDKMTYYDGFLLYGKDERAFTMEGNFNEGDKVIVQIRKK